MVLMPKVIIPKRGPLFGKKKGGKISRKVEKSIAGVKESFVSHRKVWIGVAILFVAVVAVVVALLLGSSYTEEVVEKSVLIPFLYRSRK